MNQLLDQNTPATPARFTAKQGQYLAFIWAYSQINRRAPAEADFQRYFKVTAPSVHQMLKTLDQIGLIDKQPGVARSISCSSRRKNCPFSDWINPSQSLRRDTRSATHQI
jgi:DNA-binding MarR family transcriptional regulator